MKKTVALSLLIIGMVIITGLSFNSKSLFRRSAPFFSGDYKKDWAKADSLENAGLPQSALEIVEKIYVLAKKEGNQQQFIKALIYKMKLNNYVEEDAFEGAIYDLQKELQTAVFPSREVLHSLLAEMYWMYYDNNRWKFLNRTATVNFTEKDIKTWTLHKLANEVIRHYRLSLSDPGSLQKMPVSEFYAIITKGNQPENLRPTLYDFLAHRAIDQYKNSELTITQPKDKFEIMEEFYFSDAADFVKQEINAADTLSLSYYAVAVLQELLRFRLADNNPDALIDADIERLVYAKNQSVSELKDSLYIEALKRMEKKYDNLPASSHISYLIASWHHEKASSYNPLQKITFRYKSYNKSALDLCEKTISRYPEATWTHNCLVLKSEIKQPELDFEMEQNICPGEKFAVKINYKNYSNVFVRVSSIEREKWNKLKEKNTSQYELYDKLLSESRATGMKQIALPDDGDYNRYSTETLLDGLPVGTYLLVIANNEKFSYERNMTAYAVFTVSDISYIKRNKYDGALEFYVMSRNTGIPLANVEAQTRYHKYNYTTRNYEYIKGKKYESDSNGYFIIKPEDREESRSFTLEFSKGNDYFSTGSSFYSYPNNNDIYTEYRTFLFTDRAIYRPGQTVYFKGITIQCHGDKRELAKNYSTTAILYDVNSQKVHELDLVTNEYGTFNGTFTLPSGLLNGEMRIYTSTGEVSFSMEEYKRPKFETLILPLKGNYILNDSVEIKGSAKAYAGSSISDAMVSYRIVRKPVWRGWWWYRAPSPETEIAHGKTTTNAGGEFTIRFKAQPDFSMGKNPALSFNYTVYADVTDLNGETQSAQKNIKVGYVALEAGIDLPDKVNREHVTSTIITTQNLNGEFIPASGQIKIFRLKDPSQALRAKQWERPSRYLYTKEQWYTEFPGNVYSDENTIYSMEKGDNVLTVSFNTEKNKTIPLKEMTGWKTGCYIAEISTKDAFGNAIEEKNYFFLFSENGKNVPSPSVDWFRAVKSNAEPGESAKFLIGTAEKNVRMLFTIEHKNSVVKTEWLTLNNEQKMIEIPVIEDYRGNFAVHFTFVKNNRFYRHNEVVNVPYTNKELDIQFATFRNKLYPGQQEEWMIKIKDKKGEKAIAEMLATLYDASLDAFRKNVWDFSIYNYYYMSQELNTEAFGLTNATSVSKDFLHYSYYPSVYYDCLNWFGFSYYGRYYYTMASISEIKSDKRVKSAAYSVQNEGIPEPTVPDMAKELVAEGDLAEESENTFFMASDSIKSSDISASKTKIKNDVPPTKVRTNFNETAFFYPQLQTNEKGEVIIKFTVPETLTRWRMMGFAHTSDLKYGFTENELITQKELMVLPNIPRFFRENDTIELPVKISNVSDKEITGIATLELFDAMNMKPVEGILTEKAEKTFIVAAGGNTLVSWKLIIPEGLGAVDYRITAKSGQFSDGEENVVPVLTNRMLVTESLPLPVRGKQTKTFEFTKLIHSGASSTLRNHKLTLEFTSNPAWYAVQALPYLIEYPYECSEQTFTRYYANSIASHIANSSPRIKQVFDSWKNTPGSQALLSNLEKNQELKSLLLEETPWVMNAQNETECKKRVALLFDLMKMSDELSRALNKLKKMQTPNGGFPWFPGMPDNRYITQHIVTGMGHLDKLGITNIKNDQDVWYMIRKAVEYTDERMREDYEWLKKHSTAEEMKKNNTGYEEIHYLYARSFFIRDIEMNRRCSEAFEYFKGQTEKYWLVNNKYLQAMIALSLHRNGNTDIPKKIIKSLKEYAIHSEEMGMYWKDILSGYFWYQAPIESQALLIEAFHEVAADTVSVDDMKVWLLKQKQTQDWKTTKATSEAVYALLLQGTNWLESAELVDVSLAGKKVDPGQAEDVKMEAGTGYFKTSWTGKDIHPEMGNVLITKKDEGVAWGALYWQYFEQLDKITPHETPLKLNKKLFIERDSDRGKIIEPLTDQTALKVGDKIIVRIELRVDRDMEYIHMKDMRASGFEPINVMSEYKYQGGIGYYESTKDAATNFFMHYLAKGTYVFEYPLRVSHKGNFSNGVTTIQCMYAPEFTSHSEGIRVTVE